MNPSLPPLHWLANRDLDGLNPSLWKLKTAGHTIPDFELYDPEFKWIRTIQGYVAPCILPSEGHRHLREAALTQKVKNHSKCALQNENSGLPATDILDKLAMFRIPFFLFEDPSDNNSKLPVLSKIIVPKQGFKRDWLVWSEKWIPIATKHVPQYRSTLRDPYFLIKSSYIWISAVISENRLETSEISAALTMLELGVLGVTPRIECNLCYRLAIPQRLRCFHHDQTVMQHGNHPKLVSKQSQQYAAARRACSILDWPKNRPSSGLPINPRNEVHVVAGLLWPLTFEQSTRLNHVLNEALKNCPNVLIKLPTNILELDADSKIFHLRASLDPNEWNFEAWPSKVLLAEKWLAAMKLVAPGRKLGEMTDTNIERLKLAEKLQLQGFSKSAIAEKLNISRSHLSHLERRATSTNRSQSQQPS